MQNNAMGRWKGQDSATPLGGACVREGVAEISMWMRANCSCSCRVGVGEAKYLPFTCLNWEGEGKICGRERRIGGEEGRLHRLRYIAAGPPHALSNRARWSFFGFQPVCAACAAAPAAAAPLGREGTKEARASKQASFHHQRRQTPSRYHPSPPSPSIPPAHLLRPLARGAPRTDRQASPPNTG